MSEWWRNREQGKAMSLKALEDVLIFITDRYYWERMTTEEFRSALDRIVWLRNLLDALGER
jgi:hypothetical protein